MAQEQLRTLNLNCRYRILSTPLIYRGNVNTIVVRTAEVFRPAILDNATGLIVAHNHPSGDRSPSSEDVQLTRALAAAGKLLDIELLDHLVIGQGKFVSLKSQGLGFE